MPATIAETRAVGRGLERAQFSFTLHFNDVK